MNAQILELLKNPQNTSIEDLKTLNSLIEKYPYMQITRALRLYGVKMHDAENYPKILSETAAYTTDKKILYQLINGISKKTEGFDLKEVNNNFSSSTIIIEEEEIEEIKENTNSSLNTVNQEDISSNLQDNKNNMVEVNSSIIEETAIEPEIKNSENNSLNTENQTIEKTTNSDKKLSDDIEENSSQLSFHRTEDYLPKVEFKLPEQTQTFKPSENKQVSTKHSRHEEEMQRLIAEVEAKMKASKAIKNTEKEDITEQSSDINFAETMEFLPQKTIEETPQKQAVTEILIEKEKSEWKPMTFGNNTPDALISEKKTEVQNEKPSISEEEEPTNNQHNKTENIVEESNIPLFINTWHSWLKMDKPSEIEEEIEAEQNQELSENVINEEKTEEPTKEQVIERFIENEPKISRANETNSFGNFVIKERSDDISHLMTETLATLYAEQRLYTKAIKAFEILIDKYPEKKKYFRGKIDEIKELRQHKG